jgi:hypothetical protein
LFGQQGLVYQIIPASWKLKVSQPASNRLSHDHVIKEVDLENSCTGCDTLGDPQIGFRRLCGA